ncbi:hypothetical protein BD626DRAFT_488976, partial [Schizophyllum amplum]
MCIPARSCWSFETMLAFVETHIRRKELRRLMKASDSLSRLQHGRAKTWAYGGQKQASRRLKTVLLPPASLVGRSSPTTYTGRKPL